MLNLQCSENQLLKREGVWRAKIVTNIQPYKTFSINLWNFSVSLEEFFLKMFEKLLAN